MSEHWKSTPKYWCKHCSCYVRDTKLERSNHEATARHQGALKRSLRDLHRGHEREEREKERARQEIARLNGVVGVSSSSGPAGSGARSSSLSKQAAPSESQLKAQREQLAALGVAMPSDFRPEMAIPGEWKITSTTVVEDRKAPAEDTIEGKAIGTRKREETEEQKDEEEAMRGLFKRPRRWGRDSKTLPQDEDRELDALLSGAIPLKSEIEGDAIIKNEDVKNTHEGSNAKEDINIKEEPDMEQHEGTEAASGANKPDKIVAVKTEGGDEADGIPPVVFKQRKPKKLRSK